MNSLRFTSVVGIWLCSLCAGCASPHVKFDRPLTREGAAAEGYETVIRVDQYGNVERGGDARPSDLALPHHVSKESSRRAQPSPSDPPEDAAPFNDLAAALAEQGVDAQRVEALVAAYQRDNQTPQVVTPADNSSSSTPGQAVAQASAAAPLAGVDQPTNILPAGVEPTLVHDRNFTLEFDDQRS
ncbi:MAG: hypothetical protein KDA41_15895, partial [Planctomycetales bacterium]|nr:hypothetical protein [Planctomycetales bacterium]